MDTVANISKDLKLGDLIGGNVMQIATLILGFIPFLLNNKGTVIGWFTSKTISKLVGNTGNTAYERSTISAIRFGVDSMLDRDAMDMTLKKVILGFVLNYLGHEVIFTKANIEFIRNNEYYKKYVPNILQ